MGAIPDRHVIDRADDVGTPWIECRGVVRDVVRGRVRCPERDRSVEVRTCLACRHLVVHAGERDDGEDCRTPDPRR
jgi:hypothetical protein